MRLVPLMGLLAALALLPGCSAAGDDPLHLAANATDEALVLAAPDLHGQSFSATSPAGSLGLGSRVVVRSVSAHEGDRVEAGEELVEFDAQIASRNVELARAEKTVAQKRTRALRDLRGDVREKRGDIAEARDKLDDTVAELTATRSRLVSQLAQARSALKRLEAIMGSIPPSVPGTRPAGPPPLPPGTPSPAELRTAIARLEAGIAKIDAGLVRARAAQKRLSTASATVSDAESGLDDAIELSSLSEDVASAAVDVAKARLELATLRAPVSGTVVSVPRPGQVWAPGAEVAVVRPDGATRLRTWVTAEQASRIRDASRVRVSTDWSGGKYFSARIERVGSLMEMPPTSFATSVIHLTRAVRVDIELDEPHSVPPGTPADVWIEER